MQIIYDDLYEFSKAVIRCFRTAEEEKCSSCPFYEDCAIDDEENRHIMCAEIKEYKPTPLREMP